MILASTTSLVSEITRGRERRSLIKWGVIFGFFTLVGLLYGLGFYYYMVTEGLDFQWDLIIWRVVGWELWVVLTPIVLYLAERFPIERQVWMRRTAVHVVGWLGIACLDVVLFSTLEEVVALLTGDTDFNFMLEVQRSLIGTLPIDLVLYAAIVAIHHALNYHRELQERELKTSRLEAQLAKARLQALEMQLHPHFLFNTLHTISALMDEDVEASRDILTRLSELLRLTLDHREQQEVTLRQEVAFIECYLDIQKMRFRDKLDVSVEVDPRVLEARVPHLILQPIVENAIQHGSSPNGQVSRIAIRARQDQDALVLQVADNGCGMQDNGQMVQGRGIGLSNTRERLKQLYGDHQQLRFDDAPGGGLQVSIVIPYYTAADMVEVVS